MLLNKIECFDNIINTEKKIAILGTGWIAKLIYLYLQYKQVAAENIYIYIFGNESHEILKWDIPVRFLDYDFRGPVIIAEKEEKGRLIENQYDGQGTIYSISENLKNTIDAHMMRVLPEQYEKEVMCGRKEELDALMTIKIGKRIDEISEKEDFPIFEGIEIETINRCNGSCSFCPVNRYDDTRLITKMSEELFYKIISQLKDLNYSGRVALYSNNEPFLDSRTVEFAEYARYELLNAFLYIFTNGSLLDLEMFRRIINVLDFMCLDLYYDSEEAVFSDNILEILDYCEKNELCDKVMIQTINRSAIRNNRGGGSKNRHVIYRPQAPCILPFTQMIVRPDGKLSLCCNDPLGEYTMGDLAKTSISDAWNSSAYAHIRSDNGIRKTRQNIEKCKLCDNYSTTNQNGNMIFTKEQIADSWLAYRDISHNGKSKND